MPCKNEIDWKTRQNWLKSEIDKRFDLQNAELDTLHKCLIDINICYGVLSVSQMYKALQPYEPVVVIPKNQLKIPLL